MVGILLSYWGGLFSGAFAVSFREGSHWLGKTQMSHLIFSLASTHWKGPQAVPPWTSEVVATATTLVVAGVGVTESPWQQQERREDIKSGKRYLKKPRNFMQDFEEFLLFAFDFRIWTYMMIYIYIDSYIHVIHPYLDLSKKGSMKHVASNDFS